MALEKGMKKLFDFLKAQTVGTTVTEDDLCKECGWKPSTLAAYKSKNKITPFLRPIGGKNYKVLHGGPTLTEEEVDRAMTQVTAATPPLPAAGDVLKGTADTYSLVQELGNGAIGHVWAAQAANMRRQVACKILQPRLDLLDPKVLPNVTTRFRREATNGKHLKHDALIEYLDAGEHDGTPFLVMELAKQSVVGRKLDVANSKQLVGRVCMALSHLHRQQLIHRDVKPANILETMRGIVLGDLGIVRWSDFNPKFTSANTITRDSIQLGSWYYMAPEQMAKPHLVAPASDVYALGVTWYELVTGEPPPVPQVFAAGKAPDPTTDVQVNNLIKKMTSYDAPDRPTVEEVLGAVTP
jgi:serine/threonine protein kinase